MKTNKTIRINRRNILILIFFFSIIFNLKAQFPDSPEILPKKNKYLTFKEYDATKDTAIVKFNLKAMQKFNFTVDQIDLAALYELPFKYVYLGGNKKETVFYDSRKNSMTVSLAKKIFKGEDEEYKTFLVKQDENSSESYILLVKHVPNYYQANGVSRPNKHKGNYYWIMSASELSLFESHREDLFKKLKAFDISMYEFNQNYKTQQFKLSKIQRAKHISAINKKLFAGIGPKLTNKVYYHFTRSEKYERGEVFLSDTLQAVNDGSVTYGYNTWSIMEDLQRRLNYMDVKSGFSQKVKLYYDVTKNKKLDPIIMNINGMDTIYEVFTYFTREPKSYEEFFSKANAFAVRERDKNLFRIKYDMCGMNLFVEKLVLSGSISLENGTTLSLIPRDKSFGLFSANRGWLVKSLDSAYKYYVMECNGSSAKRFYEKEDAIAVAEKQAAEEKEKAVKELSVKYGRKFVEAALEGRIIVGMHEDLVAFQLNRFWYLSSKTVGSTSAYYLKSMNGYNNSVLIYTRNKKVTRVTTW